MGHAITGVLCRRIFRCCSLLLTLCISLSGYAQTFHYKTSQASGIRTAEQLNTHGLSDTITVWCNEWDEIMASPSSWGDDLKLKSNNSFVKFYVNNYYPKTQRPFTYQLTYQIYGYTNPSDTTIYTMTSDTLTITSQNNADPLNAYQDIGLAKYSNYFKTIVVLTGIIDYNDGSPISADLTDTLKWNFGVESSILTQRYDKTNYGSGYSVETDYTADPDNNYLLVSFNLPGGSTPVQLTPVNFELEWTYLDDYSRDISSGSMSTLSMSDIEYDFTHNSTRVWLDSSHYRIPLVYPAGYIAYRVRMVRPDSSLFQYPIYSDWSYSIAASGNLDALNTSHPTAVYHIADAYTHDSLNWQYTVSFAEGGKYKHVLSFYDGLLKNRESITRFNSDPNKLIVTKNVYDYEGRPAIKTIPAPVNSTSFSFLHNVDVNSVTDLPYQAGDFDTGWHTCPGDPQLPPMASYALASIYYSNQNPDTAGVQQFVPDAGGYPMIQTKYSPAFNDRVDKQGGAGPRLQIADSNIITNYYVTTGQQVLNRLFGLDVGWNSYYNMTISRDPNMQLSMSIKNYQGKQVATSMIGEGGNPVTHATTPVDVPGVTYNQEDILYGFPQEIIGNKKIADKDFFNEVEGNDSIRYVYEFSPYPVCPGQYLSVAANFDYHVIDQCGDTVYAQDSTLGYTGVVSSPVSFSGDGGVMHLGVGPYSVHKELSIDPADVDAAIDSFLAVANCLKTEPWFVRKAVERKKFPCPDAEEDDPCAEKKRRMIRDMYPGGTYGGYTVVDGDVVGTPPSIFEWHDGPGYELPWDTIGYPHFHYQDSCVIERIPDTITIEGVDYYPIRTMSVDSFIMVFKLSIAAGDDAIAEALLPMHPEYCLLQACINDTFKTQLLAIPDGAIAEKLGLLYLDSIIAHDPLVTILGGSIADSLATFPGGMVRLDLPELIRLYCGCDDTVMMKECISHVFNFEITNGILTTKGIKEAYFTDMINLYLVNRQRYVDNYVIAGSGDSCALCDSSRFTVVSGEEVFTPPMVTSWGAPAHPMIDSPWTSGGTIAPWLLDILAEGGSYDSASLAAIADSADLVYSSTDSILCYGQIDSIMARLSNCEDGDTVVLAAIRNSLDSMCAAGIVSMGNFTTDMIRYALTANGVVPDDICNPWLIDASFSLPGTPGTESCMTDSFYVHIARYLNETPVNNAYIDLGTYYYDTLRYADNLFEYDIYERLGSSAPVMNVVTYDATNRLYTLEVFNDPGLSLPYSDTVKIYLRSTAGGPCAHIFADGATGDSIVVTSVDCINTLPAPSMAGLITEYSFVAQVTDYADTSYTSCVLLGWTDTVETMVPRDNGLKGCIPCTQMKELYAQFTDTMTALGVKGADHPLFDRMLLNFMNQQFAESYSLDQYERFIQSCALADSTAIPLYVGYSNLTFTSTSDADDFLDMLNSIDPDYNFDGCYRDSSATGATVCVDFSIPSPWSIYVYRNAINAYAGSYSEKIVNFRLDSLQADSVLGFIYAYPGTVIPSAATIFGSGGTVSISAPETRGIWMGTHYVPHDFYYVKYQPGVTPPYEISKDVYELKRYFWNNSLSATLVSNFQSTVNRDYFKTQKKDYLNYTYSYQELPPYTVLDSIQAQYLEARIPSYSGSDVSYVHPYNPAIRNNLYIADGSMVNPYFDTLVNIIDMVQDLNVVNPGHIFFDTNKVVVITTVDSPLIAYRCSDGTYWYRYFGDGDTMYNVYVDMPAWIPRYDHPNYSILSIGPPEGIVPSLGDSTTRFFTLNMHRDGDTALIKARGMTNFVIGSNVELSNVIMGNPISGYSVIPPSDTFNNCERYLLNSGIRQGIVDYNNYLDSLVTAIRAGFIDYMLTNVREQLIIGYQTQQFGYTLYYYDRAGNLDATVPPAGVNPLSPGLLHSVDTAREGIPLTLIPSPGSLIPDHSKVSTYNYNSINQVVLQNTPDAGETRFYYDAAGRLLYSQNAKQAPEGYCTYNLYDKQNRIIETGEAKLLCPYFDEFEADLPPYLPDCYFTRAGSDPLLSTLIYSSSAPVIARIKTMPHDSVIMYIRSLDRRDVVLTVYDTAAQNLYPITGMDAQTNLRKRVAATKYFKSISSIDTGFVHYDYATHYSYDITGNVKTLVQDYPILDNVQQRYKRIDYDYDLISGKVNMLSYNRSFADQYYQRYSYDDDNRITKVETSGDGFIWHRDAEYTYYEHGPLARTDVGDLRVQGIDYAYTVQGWLKVMNGDTMNRAMDMGQDADVTINAADAAAYAIDYFKDDYKPITAWEMAHVAPVTRNLYNGNIARQTMAMADFARLNKQYVYDQLNRIYTASYASVSPVDHSLTGLTDYRNNYTYDLDGNLQTLIRYGNNTGTAAQLMDSLQYNYGTGLSGYTPNELKTLIDFAPDVYTNDIKEISPSAPPNYKYDKIGNTIKDMVSGQDTIKWNLYNKVTETRNSTAGNSMLFDYDAAGNRVAKYFTKNISGGSQEDNEYYVRDAQGNILAIYHEDIEYNVIDMFLVTEAHDEYTSLGGGTGPYIRDWVAVDFGLEEAFTDAIMTYSLRDPGFTDWQTDHPVSYFLENSNKLYTDIMAGSASYVIPLVEYDQAGSDSVLSLAMKAAALDDPANLTSTIAELLTDSAIAAHACGLLCEAGADSLLSDAMGYEALDTFIVCDTALALLYPQLGSIANNPQLAAGLAGQLTTAGSHHPDEFASFLELLAVDTVIFGDANFGDPQGQYVAQMQDLLYGFAEKERMLTFFDSYVGAEQLLYQFAGTTDLLKVVYSADMGDYLFALDSVFGGDYIDSAIAEVPGLAPRPYATRMDERLAASMPGGGAGFLAGVFERYRTVMQHQKFDLAEHDIYGSSRLGVRNYWPGQNGLKWDYEHDEYDTVSFLARRPWYSDEYQDVITDTARNLYGKTHTDNFHTQHITGQKQYEVVDHLGDVLATLSDARRPDDTTAGTIIGHYLTAIKSAYDYYPFGMYMPGRYTNDTATHCTTVSATIMTSVVTSVFHPFVFTSGTVTVYSGGGVLTDAGPGVLHTTDALALGNFTDVFSFETAELVPNLQQELHLVIPARTGDFQFMLVDSADNNNLLDVIQISSSGNPDTVSFSFTPTAERLLVLGGPLSTGTTTIAVAGYYTYTVTLVPETVVTTVCSEDKYRYGYNGKFKDNEWAGVGNHYDYGARMHDSRVARFISIDPLTKKFPMLTPFQFASNSPIAGIDLDGKEFLGYTTIMSETGRMAGGLGVGGHAAIIRGTAFDMVGTTNFVAYTAIGPSNQDVTSGSRNPQIIFGAEMSGSIGLQVVHKPTFGEAFNEGGVSSPVTSVSAKLGGGIGMSASRHSIGVSAGLGLGAVITYGNQTNLKESFSVTYGEKERIGTMVENVKSFRVTGVEPVQDKSGNVIKYDGNLEAYNEGGKRGSQESGWYKTDIKVSSDVTLNINQDGKTESTPTNNWKSSDYSEAATKEEAK